MEQVLYGIKSREFSFPASSIKNISHWLNKEQGTIFFSAFTLKCLSRVFFFVLICCNLPVHAQQMAQFSQNMFNQITYNPAFAGVSGRINMVALDRHQWMGLEGAPRTTVMGAEMEMKNIFGNPGGVGLVLMNDEIGLFRNIAIQGCLSQQFFLGDGIISVGVSAAIINQVFDGTRAITDPGGGGAYHVGTDPLVPKAEVSGSAFDSSIGAWYKGGGISAGVSILHLFEPNPNFNDQLSVYIPRSFVFAGSYTLVAQEAPIEFKPSVLFKFSGNSWQLDIGAMTRFNERYWGGISYRVQDAIVLLGGFEMRNGVRVGYSYDITTSNLRKAGGGTHEVMVAYSLTSLLKEERNVIGA